MTQALFFSFVLPVGMVLAATGIGSLLIFTTPVPMVGPLVVLVAVVAANIVQQWAIGKWYRG